MIIFETASNINRRADLDASVLEQLNIWSFSWRLTLDSPLMGGGFDTLTLELFYQYSANPTDEQDANSIYLAVLAEHGFIGLGLCLAVALSCFVSMRELGTSVRLFGDERGGDYTSKLQYSLIAFFV